jgi:hypothetical protein
MSVSLVFRSIFAVRAFDALTGSVLRRLWQVIEAAGRTVAEGLTASIYQLVLPTASSLLKVR